MTEYKITLLVEQVNPPKVFSYSPNTLNLNTLGSKPSEEPVPNTELLGVNFTETSLQDAVRKIAAHAGVLLTESHEQVVAKLKESEAKSERLTEMQEALNKDLEKQVGQLKAQREEAYQQVTLWTEKCDETSTSLGAEIDRLNAELKAARAATRTAKAVTRRGVN